MKIKARLNGADVLESNELFLMDGWLAELRDEGHAESWDEDRPGVNESSYTKPGGDGRAESRHGGRTRSCPDGYTESRYDGRAGPRENGRAGPRENGRAGPRENGRAGSRENGRAGENGRARLRDDSQAEVPRNGYPRPQAFAAAPVTTPVTRAQTTGRAVIGDELRLPIMWCEMAACISWFAHPAARGEADIRARAIDAGWRLDAVGLLACPQCVQTAADFRSPLPVVLWDREKAIAVSAPMAEEPRAEAVASVARELSHDLRCPAGDQQDEAGAASAWIAAVPANDVAPSASEGTSEARHPADDHQPGDHPRPGRHRKRLAARLTFASH
jgi:hypothetical protein